MKEVSVAYSAVPMRPISERWVEDNYHSEQAQLQLI